MSIYIGLKLFIIIIPKLFFKPRHAERTHGHKSREEEAEKLSPPQGRSITV